MNDIDRKKGIRNFLAVLITITLVACLALSSIIVFPLQKDAVDIRLIKVLLSEAILFIIHTLLLGIFLSGIKINKKSNSTIMVLIVIFDITFWVMLTLSIIVMSMLTH